MPLSAEAKYPIQYRVTNVVGDTVFIDFSIRIAPLALPGGDFIY